MMIGERRMMNEERQDVNRRAHFHTRHFDQHSRHRGEGRHIVLRHDDIQARELAAGAAQIAQREVAPRCRRRTRNA
jgi:hypothetical protein